MHVGQTQARDGWLQVRLDGFEDVLAVVDPVEFVDHNGNSRDLHERADVQVAQSLRSDSSGGVDQHEPDVGSRSSNRHVARVLLVAWSVGDYEPAAIAQVHRTVGNVNRDALFSLCLEPVGQQAEIDVTLFDGRTGSAHIAGCGDGVVWNAVGFNQQTTDECALAVVNASAGDESNYRLGH